MLKQFTLYITLFWSFSAFAQPYLSARGDFSIDQQRGCRNLLITVTNINPGEGVIIYQYEGRGSMLDPNSTYNYTSAGNYWLYQYIQGPSGQKVDSILVEILDPIATDFLIESCSNSDVKVLINDVGYDLYEIDYGDGTIDTVSAGDFIPAHHYLNNNAVNIIVTGLYTTANNRCGSQTLSFTPVNTIQPGFINQLTVIDNSSVRLDFSLAPNTSSSVEVSLNNTGSFQVFKNLSQETSIDTIRGLNLNNVYCFRIVSNDGCSNFKSYSNILCSIDLSTTAVSDAIKLDWRTAYGSNFIDLTINRDGLPLQNLASPDLAFADSTVLCNTSYCYSIIIRNSDGSNSTSAILCDDAFSTSTPDFISNISSSIQGDEVLWQWQTPANDSAKSFQIYDEQSRFLAQVTSNSYQSSFIDPLVCLRLEFTNYCDNSSGLSNLVCPLKIAATAEQDGSNSISWENFTGWESGVLGYSVMVFDKNQQLIDSVWLGQTNFFSDPLPIDENQVNYYRVIATPIETGVTLTYSNILSIERAPIISIPSSFTPNGDGLNDLFQVSGKYIESYELLIINRWGLTIYQGMNKEWDGTANGKKVPLGTYLYRVMIKDFAGKEHIRSGTVLILKD